MTSDPTAGLSVVETEGGTRIELPVDPPGLSFRGPGIWKVVVTWAALVFAAVEVVWSGWVVITGVKLEGAKWWPPEHAVDWWMMAIDVLVRACVGAAAVGFVAMVWADFFPTVRAIDVGRGELCQTIRKGPFRRRLLRVATESVRGVIVRQASPVSWGDSKKPPRERATRVWVALRDGSRHWADGVRAYPAAMKLAGVLAAQVSRVRGGEEAVEVIDIVDAVAAADPMRPPPPGCKLCVERPAAGVLAVTKDVPPPLDIPRFRTLAKWIAATCLGAIAMVQLLPSEVTRAEKLRLSAVFPALALLLGGMFFLLMVASRCSGVMFRVEPVTFSRVAWGVLGRRTRRWNRCDVADVYLDLRFGDASERSMRLRLVGGKEVLLVRGRDELTMGYLTAVLRDALGLDARKK